MATSNNLSNKPGVQKIVDNVKVCVDELKTDFNDNQRPVTDDSKALQRLCVNLEFLLRHEQIEKNSFLGGRKDYWNYFLEGLNRVKGVSDGLKFVKTRTELATNVGKGRAFVRFCLMYQRLADCLQLCTSNTKLTSQWYRPNSVWRNPSQCSYLVSILYDLNDVTFDLGSQGYDLDNGWPTFSRSDVSHSGQRWNISRASSISSLSHSMLTPGSPYMSSSFLDSGTHQMAEDSRGRYETYSTAGTEDGDDLDFSSRHVPGDAALEWKVEREQLLTELATVKAELSTSKHQCGSLEKKVEELDSKNIQLVDSLNKLVQEQSITSTSHLEQISKYQELMSRLNETDSLKSAKERECDLLSTSKAALESQLTAASQRCAEQEETIRHLAEDKSNLEENLATIANSLMEKSSLLEKMTSSHNTELGLLKRSNDSLLTDQRSLQERHRALHDEHLALQEQHSSVTIDLNSMKASHKELDLSQTGVSDYTESLKRQLTETQANYKESQSSVLRLETEVKVSQSRCDEVVRQQKAEADRLSANCLDLERTNANLSKSLSAEEMEKKKWRDQFTKSEQENKQLNAELSGQKKALELSALQQKLVKDEKDQLQDNLKNLQLTLGTLQQAYARLEEMYRGKDTELNELQIHHQEEITTLKDQLTQANLRLQETGNEISNLQSTVDECQALNTQRCRLQEQVSEMEQQLVHIHTAHETLQAEHRQLEQQHSNISRELAESSQTCERLRRECQGHMAQVTELEEKYAQLEKKVSLEHVEQEQGNAQMSMQCMELMVTVNDLHSKISSADEQLKAVSEERDQLTVRLDEEQQAKQALSTSLTTVNGELESLRVTLKNIKSEAVEKSKELSDMQTCLDSTKLDLMNKQTVMEQQIGALRFQISSQQLEADLALEGYKAQQEEVQRMSHTISTQERQIASAQLQLDTLMDERSLQTDIHKQQVDELIMLLDEKEAELVTISEDLDRYTERCEVLSASNDSLSQSLVELKLNHGEQLAKSENELFQLREDNLTLKKRLVKLIRDKDTLWKTADELIFKQQLKNVVWVPSADVSNCMGCESAFSLMLRKHHCRVCGKVFCWQCSSNWVLLSNAGGKKERCCNQCYIDHSQSSPSLNSSSITNENSVDSVSIAAAAGGVRRGSVPESDRSSVDESGYSTPGRRPESSQSSVVHSDGDIQGSPSQDVQAAAHNSHSGSLAADEAARNADADEDVEALAEGQGHAAESDSRGQDVVEENGAKPDNQSVQLSGANSDVAQSEQLIVDDSQDMIGQKAHDDVTAVSLLDSLQSEYDMVVSAQLIQSDELTQVLVQDTFTVCVLVEKEETTLSWRLQTKLKPVYFQLMFKPSGMSFAQGRETLIPECKCRTHKQEFQGEMISHNRGLYIFSFRNKSDKHLDLFYLISLS